MTLLQDILPATHAHGFLDLFNKLGVKFFVRLAIDLTTVFILINVIYVRYNKKHDFIFTYFIFNLVIFLITYMLNTANNPNAAPIDISTLLSR